jgi:hypothetical protein
LVLLSILIFYYSIRMCAYGSIKASRSCLYRIVASSRGPPGPGSLSARSGCTLLSNLGTQDDVCLLLPLRLVKALASLLVDLVRPYVSTLLQRSMLRIAGQCPLARWLHPAVPMLFSSEFATRYPAEVLRVVASGLWRCAGSPSLRLS